jgi:hypothetical protein
MMIPTPVAPGLDPPRASGLLENFGFIAGSDLPDRPGPGYLLVAFRSQPTLHHYDPERVEYWAEVAGRGVRRALARDVGLPIDGEFSWGPIRIVDRLKVPNDYLAFGGHLAAASIEGTTVAVFSSPAPLLRRGGHTQGWDRGAESVGAFFGRLLVAVDYVPGFEARLSQADPLVRYAAFVRDAVVRYRISPGLRAGSPDVWSLLEAEERRLRRDHPFDWEHGHALLRDGELAPADPPPVA